MENYNFPQVFSCFYQFLNHFFYHFCFQSWNWWKRKKWWKMLKKWKKIKNNEKNSRKIAIFHFLENCNFPRVFFIFLSFLLPVVELMKNDKKWWKMIKNEKKNKKMGKNEENCNFPKNEKLQFSSSFFHFFLFSFFLSFCFQWCKNFPKNKKNAIFLEFYHFFIIFTSSGGIDEKWSKMMKHDLKKW